MKSVAFALLGAALFCTTTASAQYIELADFPSADGVRFVGNNPNSFPSQTAMPAGDFNGDGYADLLFGSPLQQPATGAYIAFGRENLTADVNLTSFLGAPTTAGFRVFDPAHDIGFEVSPAGDFNNDGYDDVLIMSWSGGVYLIYGHAGPFSNTNLLYSSNQFVEFTGPSASGAGIGDFNNDGFDDIALGYARYDPVWNLPDSGRIWVIFGRENLSGEINLQNFQASDENGFTATGRSEGQFGGAIYPMGDFNGDGFSDFAVARHFGRPTAQGYSRLIFLGKDQDLRDINFNEEPDKSNLPEDCVGVIDGDSLGTGQTYAAGSATGIRMDFNADGFSDLLIGGIDGAEQSLSFVVFGRDDNTTSIRLSDITSSSTQGLRIVSPPGQEVGTGFSWGGDVNNDGFADVVLTEHQASFNDIPNAGCAYVIWGGNTTYGVLDLAGFITGEDGFVVNGEMPNPQPFVFSTSPAGDVDGDGLDDFLLAVTGTDKTIRNSFGYNYLVKGRQSPARAENWQLWK